MVALRKWHSQKKDLLGTFDSLNDLLSSYPELIMGLISWRPFGDHLSMKPFMVGNWMVSHEHGFMVMDQEQTHYKTRRNTCEPHSLFSNQ
jgi:hypothetical protein